MLFVCVHLNPNPHGFKAPWSNSRLRANKSHYCPAPCTALHGGGGAFWRFSPEDFLHENLNLAHIIIKSTLKMIVLWKTSDFKKFTEIFYEAFLIFLNIKLKPSRTYFRFCQTKLFLCTQPWGLGLSPTLFCMLIYCISEHKKMFSFHCSNA
jgi:hypothetical protein